MSMHTENRINAGLHSVLLLAVLASLGVAGSAAGAVCQVTTDGNGDGSSWAQAANLQTALITADCTEIWVKAGSYTPGAAREDYFRVLPGVAVYGGFAGTESTLGQRNLAANLATLSGDIGVPGDASDNSYHVVYMDGTTGAGTITQSTVLDGFTVSGGTADGASDKKFGGGMYCAGNGSGKECSPTVANVTFSGNTASEGGGAMYNNGKGGISSPTLTNVTFTGNEATSDYGFGGAMGNDGNANGVSNPVLTNVIFSGNTARNSGGAMINNGASGNANPVLSHVSFTDNESLMGDGGAIFNLGSSGISSPTLTYVTFTGNATHNRGGAIHNSGGSYGVSSPQLSNVTFTGNTARLGGAMTNDGSNNGNSYPVLDHVTFTDNVSTDLGGAMHNYGQINGAASPQLSNVSFRNNSSGLAGAMYNDGSNNGHSDPVMSNVTFEGNTAIASAGAIYNDGRDFGHSSPVISNSTFSGNSNPAEFGGAIYSYAGNGGISSAELSNVTFNGNGAASGGALYNDGRGGGDVNPVLSNVILWGDIASTSGPEIYNDDGAGVSISDSVVAGGCASIIGASCGAGNVSTDPMLGALVNNGGYTQTLMPGAGSSAIDTGNTATCDDTPVSGLDQRGVPRPYGNGCDIGSVEAGGVVDIIFANGFD